MMWRVCLLGCLVLVLAACSSEPEPEPLPKLTDIRAEVPTVVPPRSVGVQGPNLSMPIATVGVLIDADLRASWEKLSEEVLDEDVVLAWERNGLRAAVLPSSEVIRWLSELPEPVWPMGRQRAMVTTGTAVLVETGRLARVTRVEPRFGDVDETRGPLSLRGLVREVDGGLGAVIVPAKPRLLPYVTAAPMHDELDRIALYDSLALPVPTGGDVAVVVSLTPEACARVQADLAASEEKPKDQDEKAEPREPWPLGVPLLVRQRRGVVWQQIVILSAQSMRGGGAGGS